MRSASPSYGVASSQAQDCHRYWVLVPFTVDGVSISISKYTNPISGIIVIHNIH